MSCLRAGVSRAALLAAAVSLSAPVPTLAASFTVTSGTTDTTAKTVTGTDTGTVQGGGTLSVTDTAITWSGPSPAPGVVINNFGTISATVRALDTSGGSTVRNFTLNNNAGALITSVNDAFRINSDVGTSTIAINNSGTIVSTGGGQGLDFDAIASTAAKVTITNFASGVIRGEANDGIRPGQGALVTNFGLITSNGTFVGNVGSSNDGIDLQAHSATIVNKTGGTISGFRHGITAAVDVNVTNEAGATIIGRNGSGVGSDGSGTVVNYGRITGARSGTGTQNGDGDGVDIDLIGSIKNFGIIEGTGAGGVDSGGLPNASEGIAMGGGTIHNAAGALISGATHGILVDDGSDGSGVGVTTITNAGTIQGLNGFGIKLVGNFNDVITNSGTISGANGLAIDMGAGNDTLNIRTGSNIVGTIDGGAGTDTVNLAGIGTFGNLVNFELLNVQNGNWTVTGVQTFAGGATVFGGATLNVPDTLNATVNVLAGGRLTGAGTIGGLVNAGTVAPGASIGTLNVNGPVTFQAGSTYEVEANPGGQSDRIAATGAAALTGGTVQVLAQNGTYARQTRYTILTATGGVSGTFAGATSNLAFLTPTLSYDPNDVFLTLNRNDITFASLAQTPNQRSVAGALDQSPPSSRLVQAVLNLTGASALQAFDALSGEVHGSVQATIVDDSRYIRQAVLGRLRQAPYAGSSGAIAALGTGGPMLAYAETATDAALAYANKKPAFPIKAPPLAAPVQTPDLTFWAQGVGAWGKIDGDGNAADASRNLGGVFTGFDRRFGEWRAGLAGGYTNASASVSARASSANIDTAYFAGYGGANFGALNFRSGAALAWHTIGTSRSIVFPGFSDQASARYSAISGQVFGEVGYGMSFGNIAVEPFAGLAWVYLNTESFNETGGVGALGASSTQNDVNYSTLGARWASNYLMPNGMMFMPRASLAWQHAFGTVTPSAALTFQNTGAPFGILGVPIARDAALVEAGGDLQLGLQTKIGVAYFGQLASNARDHSVKANFSWRF
jgi:subtilase-type serine protease